VRTRWEYLLVVYAYSTTEVVHDHPRPASHTFERAYWLHRSGGKPEKLPDDLTWTDYLGELGADGWELVTEAVRDSTVVRKQWGWPEVGVPVQIVWTFKRSAA
jgi:hypothetical protein